MLKTDIPPLPDNALIPCRAVTYSEFGRDFSVTLDMVSTAGNIEPKTLIAQTMTLWIQPASKSYLPVNGYIHTALMLAERKRPAKIRHEGYARRALPDGGKQSTDEQVP